MRKEVKIRLKVRMKSELIPSKKFVSLKQKFHSNHPIYLNETPKLYLNGEYHNSSEKEEGEVILPKENPLLSTLGKCTYSKYDKYSKKNKEIKQVLTAIRNNHNLVVWDKPQMGTSWLLEKVAQECKSDDPNAKVIYANMNNFNSRGDFVDWFGAASVNALFSVNQDGMRNALVNLESWMIDFNVSSRRIEDGLVCKSFHFCVSENPQFEAETLVDIVDDWCNDNGIRLTFLFDGVEAIMFMEEREDMISLFRYILRKGHFRVVIVNKSKESYASLLEEDPHSTQSESESPEIDNLELTQLSQNEAYDVLCSYLEDKCEEAPDECVDRLQDLSKSNINIGLEMAEIALRLSNNQLNLSAIEEAFTFLLNRRKSFYGLQTRILSQEAREALRILVNKDPLNVPMTLDMFQNTLKDAVCQLREWGILVETESGFNFVDPIYEYWIKNCWYTPDPNIMVCTL